VVYRDNAGYNLTINNLPWAKRKFQMKRYRISKTQNLALVEEKSGMEGNVNLSVTLPPDELELIVIQRQ